MKKIFLILLLAFCEGTISKINTRSNEIIAQEVKNIVRGGKPNQEIPVELKFLPEFYNKPNPELFTDQQISLTCLGKESHVQ